MQTTCQADYAIHAVFYQAQMKLREKLLQTFTIQRIPDF
jgi:hypothetical protein